MCDPYIMLYKFVNNTTRANSPEKSRYFKYVLLVVELDKDAVCFFGKPYLWLVMLFEYTQLTHKNKYHTDHLT